MHSLASLPSFPCLDAWPSTDQKRFHLGTEGDHHVFLGLLAFLPLLGCLAPYRPKTISFRYRKRNLLMIAYLVNTPHRPKHFHLNTERDNHAFLGLFAFLPLIPSLDSFSYWPKRFHFGTERDLHTFLGLLAFLHLLSFRYRKRNLLMIANFDNLGYQGFQGLQSFQGT